MDKNHKDPQELDLTKPRLASCNQKWKRYQDTVYWVDIQLVQRKELKFYQTRSNASILHDTLPAYCFSKAIVMKSEEIIYQKVYVSPRPPPTISCKDNWMKELVSDVARNSKETQRIQPKPQTQLSSTVRPVLVHQKEEHKIDFRVPGLLHAVVKEAEHLRVQELVKKIESHPHREALQALVRNRYTNPSTRAVSVRRHETGHCRNRRTKVFYSQKAWQKGHGLDHNSFRKARPGGQGSGARMRLQMWSGRCSENVPGSKMMINTARRDRLRSTVRANVPGDLMELWYGVVNLVGKR